MRHTVDIVGGLVRLKRRIAYGIHLYRTQAVRRRRLDQIDQPTASATPGGRDSGEASVKLAAE